MLTLLLGFIALGCGILRRSVRRGVRAQVWCAEGEGGFTTRSKVGFECVPNAGVGLGEVVFQYALSVLVGGHSL